MKKYLLAPAAILLLAVGSINPSRAATPADVRTKQNGPAVISLDFPGGSVSDLVAAIDKLTATPLDVIGDRAVMAAPVPSFSVHNVSVPDLIATVGTLQDGGSGVQIGATGPNLIFVKRIPGWHPTGGLNLDFPGGTLSDLLADVEKADGAPINVIGEKAALATPVPAFTVRNADRMGAMTAVGQLIAEKGIEFQPMGDGVFFIRQKPVGEHHKSQNDSYFESFQLGPYLNEHQTVDQIVSAVQTGWTLDPAHDPEALHFKFHPGTQLLLVSGTSEGVNLTRRIIDTLQRTPANHQ